jgi:Ca2+-transporting ATPase
LSDLIFTGALIGSLAYINFLLFCNRHAVAYQDISSDAKSYAAATGMTYLTIVLCQLVNILIRRFHNPTINKNMFTNPHLWLAMAFSFFAVINIIYNPWLQPFFRTAALSINDWGYAFIFTAIFFIFREIYKLAQLKR